MANNQNQLGLLKQLDVYLINADGSRKIGITRLIKQMSITEDIFKNTLYGSVRIKDAVDLLGGKTNSKLKGFPIIGEEYLQIQYITDYNEKTVNLRFAVYSISDIQYQKNNTLKEYTLNFCSEEHLIDATTIVWKKYKKQHSENIKDLCRDFLNLDDGSSLITNVENSVGMNTAGNLGFPSTGTAVKGSSGYFTSKKKLVKVNPTRGEQDLVIPRLSPIQAAELMAKRSVAEDTKYQSGTYLFFENFNGFNFCDIESLIDEGVKRADSDKQTYLYVHEDPLITKPSEKPNIQREFKTIHRMDHIHYFDTIEKIKLGMFESDVIVYDFINHKVTPSRFRFLNNEDKTNNTTKALGGFKGDSYPENSISFMHKVTSEDDKSNKYTRKFFLPKDLSDPTKDTYLDLIYSNRASYFTRLSQNMYTIYTYGDPTIKAGDVILLNIPEGDGASTSPTKDYNKLISGYFLVGTIKHIFTQTTYQTIMDVYKNAFSEPVKSTDEAELNRPTATQNKDTSPVPEFIKPADPTAPDQVFR